MFKSVAQHIQDSVAERKQQEKNFFTAVTTGDLATIGKLIKAGIDPNIVDNDELTALEIAAEKGDVRVGKYLIAQKKTNIDKHIGTRIGNTALITAVGFDRMQFVNLLLQYGANTDIQNEFGQTALHIAVRKMNFMMVKVLLVSKALSNIADAFGSTPLSLSTIEYPSLYIANTLMKWGADPNFIFNATNPLLLEIALNCKFAFDVKMAKLVINNGADVNIRNPISQQTALHMVSITGYVPMAKLLIKNGADDKLKDIAGRTAFDVAVEHQQEKLIEFYKNIAIDLTKSVTSVEEEEQPSKSSQKRASPVNGARTVRFSEMISKESNDDLLSNLNTD